MNKLSVIFAFNVNSLLVVKQARRAVTISLQTAVWLNQDKDFLPLNLILKTTFTCCKVEKSSWHTT